jgi:acetyl-CoA carboxylase biotin carboxyl carrier protein
MLKGGNSMDFKEISNLIEAVSKSKLTSFEVEAEGIRIKMEKKEEQVMLSTFNKPAGNNTTVVNQNVDEIDNSAAVINFPYVDNLIVSKLSDKDLITITAPIVGAVYLSPGPDSNNFVKVGTKVKKGTTLCIIEAMKLMNEIECENSGEIVEILVENEQMVEYGQPLFKVMKEKEG